MKYAQAQSILAGGRDKTSRPIANNTRLETREGDKIAIRLHSTDIVTLSPDDTVTVSTGGWQTVTTKQRLNEYLPSGFRLHQNKGSWYWNDGTPFTDGDTITEDGNLVSLTSPDTEKERKALLKRINAFARLASSSVPLPEPGHGDCLYCQGLHSNPDFGGTSHLESHLDEGYVVPSLVYVALKQAGNSDYVLAGAFGKCTGSFEKYAKERTKRAVSKYLKHAFGIPA